MRTVAFPHPLSICLLLAMVVFAGSACQRTTETNANINANANVAVANANMSPVSTAGIAAKEPERYRGTLVLTVETAGGQRAMGVPPLSAEIARDGADRRVAFKLPDGSDLIYLERGGEHYMIAPGRKQYAELDPESIGFQLQKLMTPGQMVSRLENLQGVERVGEETVNGRVAEKYRYTATTTTGTQAGSVETEAIVLVDRETGLPVRTELFAEASGDVQGMKEAKVIAEMRDISTDVDRSLFEIPEGFNKIPPEQVRQQLNTLTQAAAALVQAVLGNVDRTGAAPASPSPTVAASPAQ